MVYSVTFSYDGSANTDDELRKAFGFFERLKEDRLIGAYRILKSREKSEFLALVDFESDESFGAAMASIARSGPRSGRHGGMIGRVETFSVGFYDDMSGSLRANQSHCP